MSREGLLGWDDIKGKQSIYLNLGGNGNCHPHKDYENYITIDINIPHAGWAIAYDARNPIPLPADSVERILSEDFFEHVTAQDIKKILCECFRILKPGGFMRIGVPDYNNPKDKPYLQGGNDPRYPGHITLTHYDFMRKIIEETPFRRYKFWHYWQYDKFICEKIDYTLGMVKRTRDNDPYCKRVGFTRKLKGVLRDIKFIVSKKFKFTWQEFLAQEGPSLHVTSLVVDLYKD